MKIRLIQILIVFQFIQINLFAGGYQSYLEYLFLLRQPNARAEALGRGYATLIGNPFYAQFNPASSSFSYGLNTTFSYLEQNYIFLEKPYLLNIGLGYNFNDIGAFAINILDHSMGEEFISIDEYGNTVSKEVPHTYQYMLNYSYPIWEQFSCGINVNYLVDNIVYNPTNDVGTKNATSLTFDVGLLKIISFTNKHLKHDLIFGLSLSNILNSKVEIFGQNEILPSILRLSGSYQIDFDNNTIIDVPLKLSFYSEYKDLINSKYYNVIKFGCEATIFNILMLRIGYYDEKRNNYNYHNNASEISEFTYGLGFRLRLEDYFDNIPINIELDYTDLPTPVYNQDFKNRYKPYTIYSLGINANI